ncbi:glutamate 5-kinase [Desulfocicer vacuolatum DSM 3385]|uniref:Glutamate 5-kinase n=1 Tax=Desulfocicer vacuolatum DSM 3385 TaxID=1121400 RepID=A0A1W2DAS7_9BACT|nr:glutamate 5-kinase [Desulfocicer vacuolatum]SMC94354.1 glutamate 5-kinase [Desulfocicer vacuolatum DSM 3385]
MDRVRQSTLENSRRIVIKVGSGVLSLDHGLNLKLIESLSHAIGNLTTQGTQVILISSGALACGVKKIGFQQKPDDVKGRQAASAVGQAGLILAYENAFETVGCKVAQLLLTRDDLANRRRYLNARNTINTLLDWRIVPIINENDTIVTEEMKLGGNDNLGAMITLLMDADLMINLTDTDGLYDKDPREHADARLIPMVTKITRKMEKAAAGAPGTLGTGGMLTKLQAAKRLARAGIPMIIAPGRKSDILLRIFRGEPDGTYFVPGKKRLNSRKCWIAYSLKPQGEIHLDKGATRAILSRGKSILPIGITSVNGTFSKGASVEIKSDTNQTLGKGLVNYSSEDVTCIMGHRSDTICNVLQLSRPYAEVIHRDNLAITYEQDDAS